MTTFSLLLASVLPLPHLAPVSPDLAYLAGQRILREGTASSEILGAVLSAPSDAAGQPGEAPNLTSAFSPDSDVSVSRERRYTSPTGSKPHVVSSFAPGANNWDAGRRGVELELGEGAPVYAAGEGTVIYAGTLVDRQVVSIEHDDGLRTTYEPVSPMVTVGERVSQGQIIGTVATRPCEAGNCLHWGAKYGQKGYLNPMSLLGGTIRLLH
ncbi:murein DD-endopeptidase MepM/ murein hydrolase activator NlpD [Arcanobacterium wilhelmae]|uniref:Murein DD-endopeptidase MepM/ murein hydrolase activator NlpD n=1 Tax=Arcanobacterium wilhelmae TaxID=1803177 RepID=A0ABT9N9D2_9ACTO|nr:M23 family metallopeptidase [Arcanobacterium wilhelmae]MDP9800322.1 murein DD-endopeptidase MepM/ murein hydrolase activator NlpD [Arcanobacterium wilhelmae]WFN89758.1 M23 family metallopeptidase [Arcanobacterium wilhelmae]